MAAPLALTLWDPAQKPFSWEFFASPSCTGGSFPGLLYCALAAAITAACLLIASHFVSLKPLAFLLESQ